MIMITQVISALQKVLVTEANKKAKWLGVIKRHRTLTGVGFLSTD